LRYEFLPQPRWAPWSIRPLARWNFTWSLIVFVVVCSYPEIGLHQAFLRHREGGKANDPNSDQMKQRFCPREAVYPVVSVGWRPYLIWTRVCGGSWGVLRASWLAVSSFVLGGGEAQFLTPLSSAGGRRVPRKPLLGLRVFQKPPKKNISPSVKRGFFCF